MFFQLFIAKEGVLANFILFQHKIVSTYDRQFHLEQGYHSKLARDDRKHVLGLNVNSEVRIMVLLLLLFRLFVIFLIEL